MVLTGIDHRFDRERHAAFYHHAGIGDPKMQDLRFLMKLAANAMTAILPYDGTIIRLRMLLYGEADISQPYPRLNHLDADFHALIADAGYSPGNYRWLTDQKHPAGIPVKAVFNHGDIDVQDIAIF